MLWQYWDVPLTFLNEELLQCFLHSEPILENKAMGVIFQKNRKMFENIDKNLQNLKIFWKRAGDYIW